MQVENPASAAVFYVLHIRTGPIESQIAVLALRVVRTFADDATLDRTGLLRCVCIYSLLSICLALCQTVRCLSFLLWTSFRGFFLVYSNDTLAGATRVCLSVFLFLYGAQFASQYA